MMEKDTTKEDHIRSNVPGIDGEEIKITITKEDFDRAEVFKYGWWGKPVEIPYDSSRPGYTPAEEEFRVGMELCTSIFSENCPDGPFKKFVLNGGQVSSVLGYFRSTWKHVFYVQYLTRDEVLAEGWEEIPDQKSPFTGKPYKYRKAIEGPGFNDWMVYTLEWDGISSPSIKIQLEADSSWHHTKEYIYIGSCKSINDLRYISKLLNIKNDKEDNKGQGDA